MKCQSWPCSDDGVEEIEINNTSEKRWFCKKCADEERSRGSFEVMKQELQEMVSVGLDQMSLWKFFNKHRTKFFAKARTIHENDVGQFAVFPHFITCSCVPIDTSCYECGEEYGSKFYLTKDLEFLRISFHK